MKPEATPLKEAKKEWLEQLLRDLRDVKKAEFLVGASYPSRKKQ